MVQNRADKDAKKVDRDTKGKKHHSEKVKAAKAKNKKK